MSMPTTEMASLGEGWLGSLPADWELVPLKFVAEVFPSNIDKHSRDGEVSVRLCNYTDVYYNEIISDGIDFMKATATQDQIDRFRLRADDTIITKDSESADDIGLSALVPYDLDGVVCGYHLSMIRPGGCLRGGYVKRLFDSHYVKAVLKISANGLTRVGLGQYALDNIDIPLPPLSVQDAIIDFLDRETAKIDALIDKQEQLIATLREDRAATITQAVTKGLDPNVEMKDSGVDWIGLIPADWHVRQIKWGSPVRRGASPRPIDDPKYFDDEGEWSWVRISDVSSSNGRLRETTQRLSELGSSLSVRLEPGSLFVSIAGTVGKPCITEIPACIHDGFVYFPALDLDSEYLYRIFEAGECYLGLGKMGTQLNLNTDTIGSIHIPYPPRQEQCRIASFLDERCASVDALIAKSFQMIDTLREYRSALITDAVTGKIDVRGVA